MKNLMVLKSCVVEALRGLEMKKRKRKTNFVIRQFLWSPKLEEIREKIQEIIRVGMIELQQQVNELTI